MKLKEFGFRNICSYGNKLQVIKMPDSPELILVCGDNGGGKTSISTALKFSWWGKDTRRNTKDIANWFNGNGYAYSNFDTTDGRAIEIHRGSKPDFQELKINGENKTPASKAALFDMMENELIGMQAEISNNVLILSINDFKSFINMTPESKRKIINKLFNAESLDEMHGLLKADMKECEDKLLANTLSSAANENVQRQLEQQITVIEERLAAINKEKADELMKGISAAEQEMRRLLESILAHNAALDEIEKSRVLEQSKLVQYKAKIDIDISARTQALSMEKSNKSSGFAQELATKRITDLARIREDADKLSNEKQKIKTAEYTKLMDAEKVELSNLAVRFDANIKSIKDDIAADALNLNVYIKTCEDNIRKLSTHYNSQVSALAEINADIAQIDKKISMYLGGTCPECDTDLTDNAHTHSLDQYRLTRESLLGKCADIKTVMLDTQSGIKDVETQISNAKSKSQQYAEGMSKSLDSEKKLSDEAQNRVRSKYKSQYESLNANLLVDQTAITEEKHRLLEKANESYDTAVSEFNAALNAEYAPAIMALEAEVKAAAADFSGKQFMIESHHAKKRETMILVKAETEAKHAAVQAEFSRLNSELANTGNGKADEIALQESKNSLAGIEAMTESLRDERLKQEARMRVLTITKELFGDDGIKRVIFDNVLPTVNGAIERLVEQLGYKYPFSFDNNFDPKITYMGMEIDSSAISAGEDKKMDIIVILAMMELIKLKHPDINIMFLDEIFTSLDVSSIGKVVQILREYMQKFGMSVFVISHTPVPMEYFDKVIEVAFSENFSDMTIK